VRSTPTMSVAVMDFLQLINRSKMQNRRERKENARREIAELSGNIPSFTCNLFLSSAYIDYLPDYLKGESN
jgi:hypothetical protein